MRVIVQRVHQAIVSVDGQVVGRISKGYLLYIGIHSEDHEAIVKKMADKIHHLRVFEDEQGKMNLNLSQVNGSILAISQFTLYGNTKGNNRPSFTEAANPEKALKLYELTVELLQKYHHVEKGIFGSHMEVSSINDGPVTLSIEM